MIRSVFLLMILFINSLLVNAQQDIEVKIEKIFKGEELYLKMTLTNNNPHAIGIMNFATYMPDGNYADTKPSTYMTLIGSPVIVDNYESLATLNLKQHYSLKNGLTYTDRGNQISNAQLISQVRSLIDSVARISYMSSGSQNYGSSVNLQSPSTVSVASVSSSQSASTNVSLQLVYKLESEPIIFSGTLDSGRIRVMKLEHIEAGGTFIDEIQVFGNNLPNPYVGFEKSEVNYIKSIQLKLKMNYFYVGDGKRHREYFYSNVITL